LLDAFIKHLKEGGFDGYERKHLAVGIGAKQVLFNLMYALLNEGDEILIPAPYWTSYVDIADILGAKITLLPCPAEQDYKLTPAQLEAAIKPTTKLLLFNNPSNPTGMVYTPDEVKSDRRCTRQTSAMGAVRRHLQPHDLRWPALRASGQGTPGTARSGGTDRFDFQDLRHARLARGPRRRARVGCAGDGHPEFQSHHQSARSGYRRRDRRIQRAAGYSAAKRAISPNAATR